MKQILKRLLEFTLFILILSIVSFTFMKLAPGDPVRSILSVDDVSISEAQIEELRSELGLDKPVVIQYLHWLYSFIQFDLGHSYMTKQPVVHELLEKLPATLQLTIASLVIMMMISVPLGILSAIYKDSWIDHVSRMFALGGSAIPSFWLGLLLVQIFSVKLGLLPSMGKGSFLHLLLPSITLGIAMAAVYVRLIRASLIESLGEDFIRSAKSRGYSRRKIFFQLAFRHALAPVINVLGVTIGSLLGGTVIIEVIFSYPGLGKLVIDSILRRDYPVIQGYILSMGIIVVIVNLLVDSTHRYLDPKIRIKGGE
ncbi:nickel ABC transporter permease [Longirhabdus pacifica]|uniref:nickel ABC transporter permease n=1 Tax=Longirhabdus pacifica TaxID=2305227 RepID=UPI0010086950|nr:nickel ABC transporter permease [Longirhabdus pacifica]